MALARDRIVLTTDVTTAASTNYAPVTGLAFGVTAAQKYHFRACMWSAVAATTTGIRYGLSANPTTAATLCAFLHYAPNGIGTIDGGGNDDYVTTASTTGGITAITDVPDIAATVYVFEGFIVPSVSQILQLEVGPEAAAAVTVKAGSYIEWELVNS